MLRGTAPHDPPTQENPVMTEKPTAPPLTWWQFCITMIVLTGCVIAVIRAF